MPAQQIHNKKSDVLFGQARSALFATILGAAIVVYTFLPGIDLWILLLWLAAILAVNAARHYLVYDYHRNVLDHTDKQRLRRYFNVGTCISGCLWGFIGVYAALNQPLPSLTVMILLCGYLVMGASINYSIFMTSFCAFTLPIIVPVAAALLIGGESTAKIYGVLLVIFYIYSVFSALRHRRIISTFISYEINNNTLLEDLRREQNETRRLNHELEQDLIKLKKTQEQLRQEKGKAEELASRLQMISSRDGLTGIANRRSFDEFLAREWNRAIRAQTPLSLILADIDHFKPFNDYFGHQEGDQCLIRIAQILDEYARRGGDMAARYGGEEFAIILPETSLENATDIAGQIRHAILEAAILHPVSDTDNIVTMSFGVATIVPRRGHSSNALIAIADKALYQAKQEGRNRVVPAGPTLLEDSSLTSRKME